MFKHIVRKLLSPDSIHSFKVMRSMLFGHNRIRGRRGNTLILGKSIISNCSFIFHGKNNSVKVGGGNYLINSKIVIHGSGHTVSIGQNNSFKNTSLWLEDYGSCISIGDNNHFTGRLQLAAVEGTEVRIGNSCLFSSEIQIMTTDSHSILNAEGQRINPSKSIILGNHIWVGTRTIILKGVSLESDIIVGAGSIVNKSIDEPGVAVGGCPAHILKRGVNWDSKRI